MNPWDFFSQWGGKCIRISNSIVYSSSKIPLGVVLYSQTFYLLFPLVGNRVLCSFPMGLKFQVFLIGDDFGPISTVGRGSTGSVKQGCKEKKHQSFVVQWVQRLRWIPLVQLTLLIFKGNSIFIEYERFSLMVNSNFIE